MRLRDLKHMTPRPTISQPPGSSPKPTRITAALNLSRNTILGKSIQSAAAAQRDFSLPSWASRPAFRGPMALRFRHRGLLVGIESDCRLHFPEASPWQLPSGHSTSTSRQGFERARSPDSLTLARRYRCWPHVSPSRSPCTSAAHASIHALASVRSAAHRLMLRLARHFVAPPSNLHQS